MKRILKSKKGESYIYVCVLVIFISALVSVVIMYMGLTAQVQTQKREVKQKLDSCMSELSIEAFDSIKQGNHSSSIIDHARIRQKANETLGFSSASTQSLSSIGNSTMSRPSVTTMTGNGFGVSVKYTLTFPIKWNGRTFTSLRVPVTVTSFYKFK